MHTNEYFNSAREMQYLTGFDCIFIGNSYMHTPFSTLLLLSSLVVVPLLNNIVVRVSNDERGVWRSNNNYGDSHYRDNTDGSHKDIYLDGL